jgi:hypothetical protein
MTVKNKRTTIYLETGLYEALRLKAIETSSSVSELVNEAVRASLAEDADDNEVFEARKHEPLLSYDEMLLRLKRDGRV